MGLLQHAMLRLLAPAAAPACRSRAGPVCRHAPCVDSCQICHARASAGRRQLLALQRSSPSTASQVTVLDKSRADWKDFKKTDETIEEELEMHKRSGDQVRPGGSGLARGWVKGRDWLLIGAASWCANLVVAPALMLAASRSLNAGRHAHASYPHPCFPLPAPPSCSPAFLPCSTWTSRPSSRKRSCASTRRSAIGAWPQMYATAGASDAGACGSRAVPTPTNRCSALLCRHCCCQAAESV